MQSPDIGRFSQVPDEAAHHSRAQRILAGMALVGAVAAIDFVGDLPPSNMLNGKPVPAHSVGWGHLESGAASGAKTVESTSRAPAVNDLGHHAVKHTAHSHKKHHYKRHTPAGHNTAAAPVAFAHHNVVPAPAAPAHKSHRAARHHSPSHYSPDTSITGGAPNSAAPAPDTAITGGAPNTAKPTPNAVTGGYTFDGKKAHRQQSHRKHHIIGS